MIPLFISFKFVDFVDIFLVAFLMYEVYKLIRGTAGMNVFLGIIAFYVISRGLWGNLSVLADLRW